MVTAPGLSIESEAVRLVSDDAAESREYSDVGLVKTATRLRISAARWEDCEDANAPRLAFEVVMDGSVTQARRRGRRGWTFRGDDDSSAPMVFSFRN